MRMSVSEIRSEYGILKSTINSWVKDVKEIKVDENIIPFLIMTYTDYVDNELNIHLLYLSENL